MDRVIRFIKHLGPLWREELPDWNSYTKLVTSLNQKLRELDSELYATKQQLSKKEHQSVAVSVAGFDDLSHEPTDDKARMQYAARVSEFYDDILQPKIRTTIADVRELLAAVSIDRSLPNNMTRDQYDFFLRGMEAGMWKMSEWAVTLQGELKQE